MYNGNAQFFTVSPVSVTSSSAGIDIIQPCQNLPNHDYPYYGNNLVGDTFTIDHPGIME